MIRWAAGGERTRGRPRAARCLFAKPFLHISCGRVSPERNCRQHFFLRCTGCWRLVTCALSSFRRNEEKCRSRSRMSRKSEILFCYVFDGDGVNDWSRWSEPPNRFVCTRYAFNGGRPINLVSLRENRFFAENLRRLEDERAYLFPKFMYTGLADKSPPFTGPKFASVLNCARLDII